ncbi:hypothetical protein RvY_09683 [Ramazzottius varieornatus]|uniref:Uncharacterized protein n=1 Tax=Ramazzottius varieornatus TaxID=947166 RepID=A0A1D1VI19_RAMVA|nr:hypothetical protein RvY_09683 [Ramazzottius varieornatus]
MVQTNTITATAMTTRISIQLQTGTYRRRGTDHGSKTLCCALGTAEEVFTGGAIRAGCVLVAWYYREGPKAADHLKNTELAINA